jgi:hypothetical protein
MGMNKITSPSKLKPVGYSALEKRYTIESLPHWCECMITTEGSRKTIIEEGRVLEIYPLQYEPEEGLGPQLEFALKYEGINLEILSQLFAQIDRQELVTYIQKKPLGRYGRMLWYLYEFLTEERLPLTDLTSGNYIDLLSSKDYYTTEPILISRQRVRDNLLGNAQFCPFVRRTSTLSQFEHARLDQRCQEVLAEYPPEVMQRALSYLYTKETKSSFEIEHVQVDSHRAARFITMLRKADDHNFFNREDLIRLQNNIVDPRFIDSDFRTTQNYVGETLPSGQENIHYVSPRPKDLSSLLEGMFVTHQRMMQSKICPVITAGVISFGFVFMHPFEDGNGRIHRFLIHNILAMSKFTPSNFIFPISATMLRERRAYDAMLELFSRPLMPMIDYVLDSEGRMTVRNETARHYRYPDMTLIAEELFKMIQGTIETELVEELNYIQHYDSARQAIQAIVDMPDALMDLFIRLCLQNHGKLSASKRTSHFAKLTDDEIRRLEAVIQDIFSLNRNHTEG